jgi:hypothetical protein
MKKEYLIGGVLGIVLCGIVAYAVITFMGMQDSENAQQLVQQLPPVPLEVIVPKPLQPAKHQLPDQGKDREITPTSGPSDSQKTVKLKAEGTKGVMITLKSGRVIIADACREFGSQLRCDLPNGAVEVERRDIESIKEIKIMQRFAVEAQPIASTAAGADKKDESGKTAAHANVPAQSGNGRLTSSLTPEQVKRLDQIVERKTILQPEREPLIKEREQLHEDVKNMGMIRKQSQYDDLKKRISDLETKINGFNDEVKRLNEEESRLLDTSGNVK